MVKPKASSYIVED